MLELLLGLVRPRVLRRRVLHHGVVAGHGAQTAQLLGDLPPQDRSISLTPIDTFPGAAQIG